MELTTVAFFNCSSGVSGDMILGALLAAGMPLDHLRNEISKLGLPGISLKAGEVTRSHLVGTKFNVGYPAEEHARHLHDIEGIIIDAGLTERVTQRSLAVFRRLAEAEAKVHGTSVDHVHFHEVGAADAIVDIVGASIGLEYFGVDEVYSSSINVGGGTVKCDHGIMPVPAPATAELLTGIPTYSTGEVGELATPTGSAILSTLASGFGHQPKMVVSAVGYGAGSKELTTPNLLRVFIGRRDQRTDVACCSIPAVAAYLGAESDSVLVIETDIDDMNPEMLPGLLKRLMAAGALDAHYSSVIMKHGRPGINVAVICTEDRLEAVSQCLFEHSTTFGLRIQSADRVKLHRTMVEVRTPYGPIGIKLGCLGSRVVTVSPEYRDCAEAADKAGVPVASVYDEARTAYLRERTHERKEETNR